MVIPAAPYQHLQYQPISSLVAAKPGEKVLLRFVNLGYEQQAMTLGGIPMRVVGKDAIQLKNGSTDNSYLTNTIYIGPGESYDAIFTAPAYSGANGSNGYDTYLLYNRKYAALNNGGAGGYGGQMTEVRIYSSSSSLQAQNIDQPNTNPGI
jgi:FtsP/CotA-like multicopper oxidase with cupredoxin domain